MNEVSINYVTGVITNENLRKIIITIKKKKGYQKEVSGIDYCNN